MTKTSSPLRLTDLPTSQTLDYGSLEDAFPNVPSGLKRVFGDRVLLQIRTPMAVTKAGFILPEETRETERWNTQVAKVIDLGPVAFKNRDTLQPWPEGAWVQPGMYVRCPKYGGDRWEVPVPGRNESALFILIRDVDLGGEIDGDPLAMVAYLKA
jgi:co-chaperonin GroES (HSP10)